MEVTTEFDVKESLHYIVNGEICPAEVTQIHITITAGYPTTIRYDITYQYYNGTSKGKTSKVRPKELYKTKEAAAKAWLDRNGVKCGLGE